MCYFEGTLGSTVEDTGLGITSKAFFGSLVGGRCGFACVLLVLAFLSACAEEHGPSLRRIPIEINPPISLDSPCSEHARDPTILVIAGDKEPSMLVNGARDLTVIVLNSCGEPVEDAWVKFEIVNPCPGGVLSSRRNFTRAVGMTEVTLYAGDTPGDCIVEARIEDTDRVRFTVDVQGVSSRSW